MELKWPPLPKYIYSTDGSKVYILRPRVIKPDFKGEILLGSYYNETHTIEIRQMRRERAWATFFHEETHMILSDSGVSNLLSHKLEEAVCDAIATARMADMFRIMQEEQDQ